jgi:hypothetical protein
MTVWRVFDCHIEDDLGVLRTQVCVFAPPTCLTLLLSNDMHFPGVAWRS